MTELIWPAYAKINLTLEIYGTRTDGYHEVVTLLQTISLADQVRLTLVSGHGTRLVVRGADLPEDGRNLAYQAVEALRRYTGWTGGVEIDLEKHIPVAAGLGGGSADAAAVLRGLNILAGLGLQESDLVYLAWNLGADVAFNVLGGTALARGRGERLEVVGPGVAFWLVLVRPDRQVYAGEAYKYWDAAPVPATGATRRAMAALETGELARLAGSLFNALEEPVAAVYPEIAGIKGALQERGLVALMSGSGPCVYGIAEAEKQARETAALLQGHYPWVQVAHNFRGGQS